MTDETLALLEALDTRPLTESEETLFAQRRFAWKDEGLGLFSLNCPCGVTIPALPGDACMGHGGDRSRSCPHYSTIRRALLHRCRDAQ